MQRSRECWILIAALAPLLSCSSHSDKGTGGTTSGVNGAAGANGRDAGAGGGQASGTGQGAPDAATSSSPSSCNAKAAPQPGEDPCSAPLAPGADRTCAFSFNGQMRDFLLYAPKNYDPCKPAAAVVDAHGAAESAEAQAGLAMYMTYPVGIGSSWRLVADREGFIVVTPQGVGNRWGTADVDFILEVVSKVKAVASVDPQRIYMSGISNGGILSYWTACRNTDVFAGYAPVAGASTAACSSVTHVAPLIGFHATGDQLVSYSSGTNAATAWAANMHCKNGPIDSLQFGGPLSEPDEVCIKTGSMGGAPFSLVACDAAGPASTCQSWNQCDGNVEVVFCTVNQPASAQFGGHILYINGSNLSLAAVAWNFFKKFQH